MTKLELILENIRLSHIEQLLMEAGSQDEIQRGIQVINESIHLLANNLMEEMAVHANHHTLDKSKLKDPNTSYDGKIIADNRKELADTLKMYRGRRDNFRKRGDMNAAANQADNIARAHSSTGNYYSYLLPERELLGKTKYDKMIQSNPRMVQSAIQ